MPTRYPVARMLILQRSIRALYQFCDKRVSNNQGTAIAAVLPFVP
jgi:hypothetical protein